MDDIGALAVGNALADAGYVKLIAVGHTNGFPPGIGAVSTVMHFYGRDDVPLGAYKGVWARDPNAGKGTADKYITDLVTHFPSPIKNYSQVTLVLYFMISDQLYLSFHTNRFVHMLYEHITTEGPTLLLNSLVKYVSSELSLFDLRFPMRFQFIAGPLLHSQTTLSI